MISHQVLNYKSKARQRGYHWLAVVALGLSILSCPGLVLLGLRYVAANTKATENYAKILVIALPAVSLAVTILTLMWMRASRGRGLLVQNRGLLIASFVFNIMWLIWGVMACLAIILIQDVRRD